MLRRFYFLALLLALSLVVSLAREIPDADAPAFTPVPELRAGLPGIANYHYWIAERWYLQRLHRPL